MTEIKIDFNNEKIGLCTEEMINGLFPNHPRIFGVKEGFCSIIKDPLDNTGNALQIKYPKEIIQEQKTRIYLKFESTESATLTYKVFFPEGFDFVRGGKLPGLYGGTAPRGGKGVAVDDGFSIRTMWRELGSLCSYVYYMDMNKEKKHGENFLWTNAANKNMPIKKDMWSTMNEYFNDRMYISTNKWLTLKTYVKMNTPGQEDGKIICWLDGKETVNVTLRFRKDLSFGIDTFAFTTFFGGNDPTWVPSKDEVAYFKDFSIVMD